MTRAADRSARDILGRLNWLHVRRAEARRTESILNASTRLGAGRPRGPALPDEFYGQRTLGASALSDRSCRVHRDNVFRRICQGRQGAQSIPAKSLDGNTHLRVITKPWALVTFIKGFSAFLIHGDIGCQGMEQLRFRVGGHPK